MSNAAIYNLLNFDDSNQDALLVNNAALLRNIKQLAGINTNKVNQHIADLKNQIEQLQSQLLTALDNRQYASIKNNIAVLQDQLNQKIDDYNLEINPSYTDITSHFVFINHQYKPFVECTFAYLKSTINTKPIFGTAVDIPVLAEGNFISDMALHIELSQLEPLEATDKVRYTNFLGHRLIKNVQLIINNIVIDQYTGEFYNAYYNVYLPDDKKKGWLRCIGQEMPVEGTLIQDPINDNYREQKWIYTGYQTLKEEQDVVDLYIPLLFWFNINKTEMLLNNFPANTIFIRVEFEEALNLMTCLDVKRDIYNEKFKTPTFDECELYTNHVFINEEVQDLFISKLGFSLIRTHLQIKKILNINKDRVSLSSDLKFPVEDICIYARPDSNESGIDSLNLWHKNSIQVLRNMRVPIIYNSAGSEKLGINNIIYYDEVPLFSHFDLNIDLTSTHGTQTPNFFQGYIPLVSGNKICTNNNHVYYLAYNLYPKEYQPSGYINMSKSRDIYFEYGSNFLTAWDPVNLYIHATCINFLIYNNDSAMLNFNR